jgi:HAD superfamily hydrolase (TIGR01509 family)
MPESLFALVIFDCDGVLIDSEAICARVQADALSRLGYPITYDDMIRRFTGVPDREMYVTIEREFGRPLPPDYDDLASREITKRFTQDLRAIPGVHVALAAIELPICVASSATADKLQLGLSAVGLYDRFAPNVFSADEVDHGKPAPDLFLHAARRMQVAPHRCLVVEDSVAGVTAAVAAGMRVAGFYGAIHCGPEHPDVLAAAGADTVFGNMADLPTVVARAGWGRL